MLAGRSSYQVVGDVFDRGEVGGCVIGSDPAPVVAEYHVQNPMQAVLYRPMTAHDRPDKVGQQDRRGDIKACLALDLVANRTAALDDDNTVEARRGVPEAR